MGEEGDKDAEPTRWPDDANNITPSTIPRVNGAGSSASPLARQPSISSSSSATSSSHTATGSTARRPSKPGQQASPQSKNFEFVLVTDNESRRQVRRHAMRQYMHQRRLDSIARLGTSRIPISGWTTRTAAETLESPGKVEDVQDEPPTKTERSSPSSDEERRPSKEKGKEPSRLLLPRNNKVKREEELPLSLVKPKYPEPRIIPEPAVVRDPFSTYPVPINNTDQELVQHFVVTYPSMMYKFVANNPMLEIFRQFAMHDELPFQAMLAIASKHRAGVEGKTESVQSLTHKMRALRLMNERIQVDSTGQRDGTIYAVATMAVIEKWSKDASIERMHFRGLASMIRNRGGMQGMRASSPFLERVIYWVDFSCAPKAIVSTALPWTGSVPDIPPAGFNFLNPDIHLAIPHTSGAPETMESLCDQFRACEDFLRFFRHLHELERAALNSSSSLATPDSPPRRKTFVPGTRLHSILTLLPDYDHGIRDIRFIDEYTCMSCLFFLVVALHHCYSTSTNFDHYLAWLDNEIHSRNRYGNPGITSILWLFLDNNGGIFPPSSASPSSSSSSSSSSSDPSDSTSSGARCWVVSRMVRVAKHLEWKRNGTIWDRLRQVLIDFLLTQQDCALGSDLVDTEALAARAQKRDRTPAYSYFWNEDEMRHEILDMKIQTPTTTTYANVDINIPILT